jgi:SAM-dependent methyltransferase
MEGWKSWFIDRFYSNHNDSPVVKRELDALLGNMPGENVILNVGSGNKRLRPWVQNLDITPGSNVDYVASAECMPIESSSVDILITQETFEHISSPGAAMNEVFRVLKPGGQLYLQVPFIIGYHSLPSDFWRFSQKGIEEFVRSAGFIPKKVEIATGSATGFYRIATEFMAILFSLVHPRCYLPAKGVFAFLLYPIKALDGPFRRSAYNDRIAGGCYCIAQKPF